MNTIIKKHISRVSRGIAVLAVTGTMAMLGGCQADMDNPGLQTPVSPLTPNITLLELKEAYNGITGPVYMPGTWELEEGRIVGGDPVIVHGRVISSDATGNIYKSLVIQDETAALSFSINQGWLFNTYRLGQEVVVDLTGLTVGNYRNLQQIGTLTDETYDDSPQVGFMAYDVWLAASHLNGLPDPAFANVRLNADYPESEYYCITFDDFDQLTNATPTALQSQLVEFRNVHFDIKEGEETYAPYQESVNRTIVDVNGKTLTLRNSGYSNFYNQALPEGRGTVRGILSYYGSDWQLVIRGPEDVMITHKGESGEPFTVSEILSGQYEGYMGWAEGYIVGSVKAGVSTVASAADVAFGAADAELDNNVLIAARPDESDWTKCVLVELPQGTMLRDAVNLLDNPGVVGKSLMLRGTLGFAMGIPAVNSPATARGDFLVDGIVPSDGSEPVAPAGSGTEADPYNVAWVKASSQDLNEVWVEGYVAGYVSSGNFSTMTVQFTASQVDNSGNWLNQSNILLSDRLPHKATAETSMPAQLTAATKPQLGLRDNPAAFGAKVKVKCNVTTYLGTRGIRNITDVKF